MIPHPSIPEITVGGNYSGYLGWQDRRINQERDISVYPKNPVGEGSRARGERFQWTFPVLFSPHDENVLYTTSQHVFRSTDKGLSWDKISEDLTKNDSLKQVPSGGPITKDNTGVEVYNTVFAFAESPVQKGVLWAGSDCGLIHVSKDNGETWTNVTPSKDWGKTGIDAQLGKSDDAIVSVIEPSYFKAGTAYAAVNRYKLDDFEPYIYRTTDFGASWKRINKGIPSGSYVRVVREDPHRDGLLYAGTERGLYVSFDEGDSWSRFRLNLPLSPIRDLRIQKREKDLVIGTHGRSFWILDDLSPLHQYKPTSKPLTVYKPRTTYRVGGGSYSYDGMEVGENAPNGVLFHYTLADTTSKELSLMIRTQQGDSIISYSSTKKPDGKPFEIPQEFYRDTTENIAPNALGTKKGMNRFRWNMRYPNAKRLPGTFMWGGGSTGPKVMPGTYVAEFSLGDDTQRVEFDIVMDPRLDVSRADLQAQFDFLMEVRDTVDVIHKSIGRMKNLSSQINSAIGRMKDLDTAKTSEIKKLGKKITDSLSTIQGELVQTKAKAFQDLLNYPVKLNNKIASLSDVASSMDGRPTKQTTDLFTELSAEATGYLDAMRSMETKEIAEFNEKVAGLDLPAVILPKDDD